MPNAGLYLVNVLDVARVFGPDPSNVSVDQVHRRLDELYLRNRGGGFNHDPSILATHDLFRGALRPAEAEHYCLTNGNPKGRAQNAQIIRIVSPHASDNVSRCHRIGYVAVRIGRFREQNIHIGIKAPFIRVRRPGEAYLVIPGFRKDSRPVGWQIEFVCSLAARQLARDDYEGADVEYLYAGPALNSNEREFRALYGRNMNLLSADRIDEFLQIYLDAVVRHLERGTGVQPARFAGYRIIDPAQGGLF
jgi:hypothetical protein